METIKDVIQKELEAQGLTVGEVSKITSVLISAFEAAKSEDSKVQALILMEELTAELRKQGHTIQDSLPFHMAVIAALCRAKIYRSEKYLDESLKEKLKSGIYSFRKISEQTGINRNYLTKYANEKRNFDKRAISLIFKTLYP